MPYEDFRSRVMAYLQLVSKVVEEPVRLGYRLAGDPALFTPLDSIEDFEQAMGRVVVKATNARTKPGTLVVKSLVSSRMFSLLAGLTH